MTAVMTVIAPDPDSERVVRSTMRAEGVELVTVGADEVAQVVDRLRPTLVVVVSDGMTGAGLEVCSALRHRSDTRLVMLSSSPRDNDEVMAFAAGCDDYVRTPCGATLLSARLRARLVRCRQEAGRVCRFDCLGLDRDARRVTVHAQEVRLTRTEFDLLRVLLQHPHQVLTRAQLLELVWHGAAKDEHVLEVHLSRLRSKIAAAGGPLVGDPVPGVGYRLAQGPCPPPGVILRPHRAGVARPPPEEALPL